MISFDTDGLKPAERFDHWCEVRAKELFGVTIEVPRERRPDCHGRFSARQRPMGWRRVTCARMRTTADVSPLHPPANQPHHQQQDDGADRGIDDLGDQATADMNAEL